VFASTQSTLTRIKRAVLAGNVAFTDKARPLMLMNITSCPTCGSRRIKRVRRTIVRRVGAVRYQVPDLEFFECPVCGERLFDRAASHKIDAASPSLRSRARRKSA
jgi:YgiT-type zinc finger domain-containing protein